MRESGRADAPEAFPEIPRQRTFYARRGEKMADARGGAGAPAINLSDVDEVGIYIVVNVKGSDAQIRRLNDIGLIPGMRFAVTSCSDNGMMVVKIGPGRIALARTTSETVWVKKRG